MEGQKKMMVVFGLVAAVFLHSVAAQTVHVVGGSIVFNFATNTHDVVEVPKASFDSCSPANPIDSTITTGPTNITLTAAGDHYYICTFGHHFQSGQKLAITVSTSATSPGASPSASTLVSPEPPTATTTPTTCSPTSDAPYTTRKRA
ncbi:umecyanin-like [Rosa chinensis]|uniref:umecyanin-like n=1 Tax=Rosa chinensis TaxID=74649 RepID=UPI000D087FCD|nr:umecyanin-like [Rosa chinensis]